MTDSVSEDIKQRIIAAYLRGMNIRDIGDLYRIDEVKVARVLRDSPEAVELSEQRREEKERLKGKFEKDKSITTKDTLADLHKETLRIVKEATDAGAYRIALQAIGEATRQTEITMKSKGELNTNKLNETLIPPDFVEFFVKQLENQKELENTEEAIEETNDKSEKTDSIQVQ